MTDPEVMIAQAEAAQRPATRSPRGRYGAAVKRCPASGSGDYVCIGELC